MAEHLNANVPGIDIPAAVIARIAGADDAEAAACAVAADTIRAIRPMCRGCHIMAIGWERLIPRILAAAQ
jgi:5,10-methylenetetrahydrofolate reductase